MLVRTLRQCQARTRALTVAILMLLLAVAVYELSRPVILNASISAVGVSTQVVTLPFQSDHQTNVDMFAVRLQVWKPPFSSSHLKLHPDDCILSIGINGGPRRDLTHLPAEHRCWPHSYLLIADDDLQIGPNAIDIVVNNTGGPYSFNAIPVHEPRRAAPVVLPLLYLCLFVALPWLIPERWSWPWRSWEAGDHRRYSWRYGTPCFATFAAFAAFPLAHATVLFATTSSWMAGLNPDHIVHPRFLFNLFVGTLYHVPLVALAWALWRQGRSPIHVRMHKANALAAVGFAIAAILLSLWKVQDWPALLRIAATCAALTCIVPCREVWSRLKDNWSLGLVALLGLAPAYTHLVADMVWDLSWELQTRILSNALSLYGIAHEIADRAGQFTRFGHGVLFEAEHWRMWLVERCAMHWLYSLYVALLCSAWLAFREHSGSTWKAIACAVIGLAIIAWANAVRIARTFAFAGSLDAKHNDLSHMSSLITQFHNDDGRDAQSLLVATACLMALVAAYWMHCGCRRVQ